MKVAALRVALALCLTSAAVGSAEADSIVQSRSVTYSSSVQTDENSAGFLPFDGHLGVLNSVTASFVGTVLFAPSAPGGSFTFFFNHYLLGNSGELSYTDTQSSTFRLAQVYGPQGFTDSSGFKNYFLVDLDVSTRNGSVLAGSTATGSLTYDYTPAAVTPEPSSLLLLGTALAGISGYIRSRRRFGARAL